MGAHPTSPTLVNAQIWRNGGVTIPILVYAQIWINGTRYGCNCGTYEPTIQTNITFAPSATAPTAITTIIIRIR